MKKDLKKKAIELRKKGLTYSEILKLVSVAKSTLSLWLFSVGLSKKQQQRITEKKLTSARKGGLVKKQQRMALTEKITTQARSEINKVNLRELWFMGIMLYWAEGAKQKNTSISQGVVFSNSDPFMIRIFLKWLKECIRITNKNIKLEICVHENEKQRINQIIKYWSKITRFFEGKFDKIYYKKHKINSIRKNQGINYYGQLRIVIKKSTNLNRKISGWIEGICNQCGVV